MPDHRERRAAPRKKLVRAAISRFDGPQSPVPCVLLDLSATGARLNVHDPVLLPDEFQLKVDTEHLQRRCRIVWRRGEEVGVEFIDA